MELLVVRHAVAEDRERFAATGRDDSERPLTRKGRRAFKEAVRGLRELVPSLDLVVSSHLARAAETADLLAGRLGAASVRRLGELAPDAAPEAMARWLSRRRRVRTLAVVGHEPQLSLLVGLLLSGSARQVVALEKGGACLLELEGRGARLRWLLTPAQLRRLRRR